jgi:hypothetical protein
VTSPDADVDPPAAAAVYAGHYQHEGENSEVANTGDAVKGADADKVA